MLLYFWIIVIRRGFWLHYWNTSTYWWWCFLLTRPLSFPVKRSQSHHVAPGFHKKCERGSNLRRSKVNLPKASNRLVHLALRFLHPRPIYDRDVLTAAPTNPFMLLAQHTWSLSATGYSTDTFVCSFRYTYRYNNWMRGSYTRLVYYLVGTFQR